MLLVLLVLMVPLVMLVYNTGKAVNARIASNSIASAIFVLLRVTSNTSNTEGVPVL